MQKGLECIALKVNLGSSNAVVVIGIYRRPSAESDPFINWQISFLNIVIRR